MYFPKDVVIIIRDFSQPITRPGWRKLHIMTLYNFYSEIRKKYYNFNIPVINSFVKRHGNTEREQIETVEPRVYCAYMSLYIITSSILMFGVFLILPRTRV